MNRVKVVGAGLAGCEAAWQLANRGVPVLLCEGKPEFRSPAHKTDGFAELVCSNSLRANDVTNAVGLLKEEMRRMNSLILRCADECSVPAGGALAVDRTRFSEAVTRAICAHPLVTVEYGEVTELPEDGVTVIATGPLTSDALAGSIRGVLGEEYLHFFDAAAPIVTRHSLLEEFTFAADRYGKGDGDYVNCPMTKEQYLAFYSALISAQTAPIKEFEQANVFEGCMPIEVMAARGEDAMRFGPLKPVGLTDPATGKRPYAVVQLRKENAEGTLFNLVGFQTHLTFGEQRRVFGLIPALREAEFVRFGVMHRNTFLNSPKLLNVFYQLKNRPNLFFAGQMTGVEGYVESASSGLAAGVNAAMLVCGKPMLDFTAETATGALQRHVACAVTENFQPMNVNFGIMAELSEQIRDKSEKRKRLAERALDRIAEIYPHSL